MLVEPNRGQTRGQDIETISYGSVYILHSPYSSLIVHIFIQKYTRTSYVPVCLTSVRCEKQQTSCRRSIFRIELKKDYVQRRVLYDTPYIFLYQPAALSFLRL